MPVSEVLRMANLELANQRSREPAAAAASPGQPAPPSARTAGTAEAVSLPASPVSHAERGSVTIMAVSSAESALSPASTASPVGPGGPQDVGTVLTQRSPLHARTASASSPAPLPAPTVSQAQSAPLPVSTPGERAPPDAGAVPVWVGPPPGPLEGGTPRGGTGREGSVHAADSPWRPRFLWLRVGR